MEVNKRSLEIVEQKRSKEGERRVRDMPLDAISISLGLLGLYANSHWLARDTVILHYVQRVEGVRVQRFVRTGFVLPGLASTVPGEFPRRTRDGKRDKKHVQIRLFQTAQCTIAQLKVSPFTN